MKNFQKNIDKMISRILSEEIDAKTKEITDRVGEWVEIDTNEELHGGQTKLDVAKPKGKLTAADFKKLRDKKSNKKDVDEEDVETDEGNAFSGALAQAKESGDDSFKVDGHKYPVKETNGKKCPKCGMVNCKCNHKKETEDITESKNWIQKTDMKKGALHKKLGIPEGDKIPKTKLNKIKKELETKAKGDKKLSSEDSKLLKQVNLALTLGNIKESNNTLSLTESELIDMIEKIVLEQKAKDVSEKSNISLKTPEGLKVTDKVLGKNKKANDDYIKDVTKKLKDYLKTGTNGKFEMNPEEFPKSNYDMEKGDKIMKYNPSDEVDEYIEAFSYPGMTNLVFDEIKPDDKKIEKYLKGDSTTGNAVTDSKGKPLGNVGKSKVGDRFKKNYDDNLYGAEQMNASYKRQSQPVDMEGEKRRLKSKKSSIQKSAEIFNKLDESKETKKINEDLRKMKNLISYSRKTQ